MENERKFQNCAIATSYDPDTASANHRALSEAAPCLADVTAMVPLFCVLTLALDARISVRPTGPAGQPRKAYICAEVTEAGRFGDRTRVVGAVTIREQELTADGRSAASCRSDPQPTSMSAYMSALHVDVAYRKKMLRVDGRRSAIAMELMRECEAVALEWGHGATYLNVYERNEGAVRLYTSKLGYEVISEPSTQPRAREGRPGPAGPLPVFRMRKTLVGAPMTGVVVPTKRPLPAQQQPQPPSGSGSVPAEGRGSAPILARVSG